MSKEKMGLSQVFAVVVTYNVGNDFASKFNGLKGQVDHAILVNTSTDAGITKKSLLSIQQENPEFVTILECAENNLAKAQNMGIDAALAAGAQWVLLLDHDSRPKAGMIAAMGAAYQTTENPERIALIAPQLVDDAVAAKQGYLKAKGRGFEQVMFDENTPVIEDVLCVAASGSLIPRHVFENGVRMDEALVIDYIDTEFCLRLVAEGGRIIAVRDAVLQHKFGARRSHRFLWWTLSATHHSAHRRYYLYRNRIHVWKQYGAKIPAFLIFDLARTGYELWRIALFESQKMAKFSAILEGIVDGLFGRMGARKNFSLARMEANV